MPLRWLPGSGHLPCHRRRPSKNMLNFSLLLPLTIFITCGWEVSGLRVLMLDVPSPTIVGESVELSCSYDLEGDKLYSVKWYKNDVEFYRYVPKDWPPGQFLPIPGIRVDLSRSSKSSVYLKHVDLHSTGTYRCEVSAEAPAFITAEAEKDMKVFVLPAEGPRITGSLSDVKVGDVVSVLCISAKSKPAAQLRWYINNQLIESKVNQDYETSLTSQYDTDGLGTSTLGLKFAVAERHLKNGNLRLKCTASISRMYTMSNEALLVREEDAHEPSSGMHIKENLSQDFSAASSALPSWSLCAVLLLIFSEILIAQL